MSLWVVRAGKYGEQEQTALDNNLVTMAWNEFDDLSKIEKKEQLTEIYTKLYPDFNKYKIANQVGQVWRFAKEIKPGDMVALPLKTQSAIAIGTVTHGYHYKVITDDTKHLISVKWINILPRSAFPQDILYSLGAIMTIFKVTKHDAENRIKKLLAGTPLPQETEEQREEEEIDIDRTAKDKIIKFIDSHFKGHDLARLVDAILKAQGYTTYFSPPGPDGGLDILAAGGPLGFDEPKICVQVKSSSSSIDVVVVRELQGVLQKVRATQGLLVSWGGFTNIALKEARDAYFSIRLWDQDKLLDHLFKYYDRFDDDLKAELPLKKVWALIEEE